MIAKIRPRFRDLRLSVSATTRKRRRGEEEGRDYFFLVREDFKKRMDRGDFLEHAEYGGNLYGTPRQAVEDSLRRGCDVLLEIELQGAMQVHDAVEDAVMVFVAPPDLGELETRLRRRDTESEGQIQRRMDHAREELAGRDEHGKPPEFDYAIVNVDVCEAADSLARIIEDIRVHDSARHQH